MRKGSGVRENDALIVLAKAPIPGRVKTRLSPPLSARRAAELYACLLADTAEEMSRLRGASRYLFYSPPGSEPHFRRGPFEGYELRLQAEGHLGDRMFHAFRAAFARGAKRAVLVGADCPGLSVSLARSAFRELAFSADAVFGPSRDGGFYLIALSAPAPFLVRGIEWGSDSVLSSALARCRLAGFSYALLPALFDVDSAEDVSLLTRWVATRASPACPRTRGWLTSRGGGSAPFPSRGRRSRSGERSPSAPPPRSRV